MMSEELQTIQQNTDLVIPDVTGLAECPDEVFESIAGDSYLPRLSLCSSSTKQAKQGKVQVNNYAIIGSSIIELGKTVDVFILKWRPKALDLSDSDNIVESYDYESDVFKKIEAKSAIKDSRASSGPEFLVYIPEADKFATIMMGSKSDKRVAPEMKARLGGKATFDSQYIEKGDYAWQAKTVKDCSTPLQTPTQEQMTQALEQFKPQERKPKEMAPDDGATDRPQ